MNAKHESWCAVLSACNCADPENRARAARLDADGTARPLTEIAGVFDRAGDEHRTRHIGQAREYVARPTPPPPTEAEYMRDAINQILTWPALVPVPKWIRSVLVHAAEYREPGAT